MKANNNGNKAVLTIVRGWYF